MPHRYNSMFWKKLGDSYVRNARYDSAIYSYKVALKYDPGNRLALNNLGYAYKKVGNEEEARMIKKKLVDLPGEINQVETQQDRSLLENPLLLFLIFFIVVWGLLFLYWHNLLENTVLIVGMASTGILALIITAWGWVFFYFWDSDTTITRIVALIITAVIGGLILLLFRRTYTWILDIR